LADAHVTSQRQRREDVGFCTFETFHVTAVSSDTARRNLSAR
jgi:hypothetical protein